jgi:hypothetical protein
VKISRQHRQPGQSRPRPPDVVVFKSRCIGISKMSGLAEAGFRAAAALREVPIALAFIQLQKLF